MGEGVAARVERNARHSGPLEWAVRLGLLAYGAVHLLIAWVAVALISGDRSGSATGQGALAQLAGDAAGRATLGAMGCAFAALLVWQLIAAAVGYRALTGWSRPLMRAGAAGRVAVYAYFGWASGRLALQGASGSGRSPQSWTSRLLAAPAGAVVLTLTGGVVVVIGLALAVFGWRRGFLPQLDDAARRADRRVTIVVLGRVGYVVKGLAFVVVGVLLAWAALSHDPHKTGGLDQELYLLLGHQVGRVAVVVVGAGIGCFGLYLFARARHLARDTLTS